jgi:hypothetical protein
LRFVTNLLLLIGVALAFGFGLSWFAVTDGRLFGVTQVGPWTTWREAGSPTPDPYTRAYIARTGALQLGASEGLQFLAATDSDGQALNRSCRYRIDGVTPIATFWTLTAVDATGALVTRPDASASLTSTRIARANDGSMELYVSRSLAPRNWLEIVGDGPFALALNLYDTSSIGGVGTSVITLPSIIREACA